MRSTKSTLASLLLVVPATFLACADPAAPLDDLDTVSADAPVAEPAAE